MIRSCVHNICILIALSATAAVAHAAAVGTAFTYQGSLYDSGAPADGIYDINFSLMDSAAAGVQIGATSFHEDVLVTDGLFTVTVDFGTAALDGQARWLQVYVRPGATFFFFTPLEPRQALSPTPYAAHALASSQWKSVGASVTNANTGFVGVNRSGTVSGSEVFGVQAAVSGTSFGGMYVNTTSATGKPYYGYSTGTESAWTYLDGSTGDWILHNGGPRMTVTDDGLVGLRTTAPNASLHVENPDNSGDAGRFEITSQDNAFNALRVRQGGLGRGAFVEVVNSNNASPALEVQHAGDGPAAKFVGEVETLGDLIVDGHVKALFGASDFARGTPIAYGRLDDNVLVSSSGNVTVQELAASGDGNQLLEVTVQGESAPSTWIIAADIYYTDPVSPSATYDARVGYANASGQFKIYVHCANGCNQFMPDNYDVNFVVYRP